MDYSKICEAVTTAAQRTWGFCKGTGMVTYLEQYAAFV